MKTMIKIIALIAVPLIICSCNNGYNQRENVQDITLMQLSDEMPQPQRKENSTDTEEYSNIIENRFVNAFNEPLSTFSIDVDRASYSNIRRFIQNGLLPPPDAVRIEEMINYFDYDYPQPQNEDPFSINTEMSLCPWNKEHKLVHIGLQGKEVSMDKLPASNLVFLIDVSGSMSDQNKLPLVQSSLKMLINELRENDKVAIVTYAGNAGLVLPSTRGTEKEKIKAAIDNLSAGGSTAGGEGIELAYKIAVENFKKNGNNRIIVATDGDFNVGISNEDELVELIEEKRESGIYLTVLGYGMGNYKDNKMQLLADKGNGNHAYIDNISEARKVLVNEFAGTLFTIAKDVKLQVEFNPQKVQSYRLIGYENRVMASEDFNNDKKDAGELGAGHTVTALYEIIPVGVKDSFASSVNKLKYQHTSTSADDYGNELLTIKFRYKSPKESSSKLITHPVLDNNNTSFDSASDNFKFSAAVAEFGLLLRNSSFKENASYKQSIELAKQAKSADEGGYRAEFIQLVENAAALSKGNRTTMANADQR